MAGRSHQPNALKRRELPLSRIPPDDRRTDHRLSHSPLRSSSRPHQAILLEDRISAQHRDFQTLLSDNQRLAATHMALKQELPHLSATAAKLKADRAAEVREVYAKSMKMDAEVRAMEAIMAELNQVQPDIQNLSTLDQEQAIRDDLTEASSESQPLPYIEAEIDEMHHEIRRGRGAIEYKKRTHASNLEQGEAMEKGMVSMSQEVENMHAYQANAEKRATAAAAVTSPFAEQYSVFRSRLKSRRFDDSTLQILEFFLASKDAMSLMDVKSSFKELLRFESLSIIRETAEKTDEQKLLVIEFLVGAFALVGDIESCLALRYEALNFRVLKSLNQSWLQVSHEEWLNFAEHSLQAGFFPIAIKAYEQALSSLQQSDTASYTSHSSFKHTEVIEKIKRQKDHALNLAGSHSVQALTTEYLKKKVTERNRKISSSCTRKFTASTLFRNGIRNYNSKKLHEIQNLEGFTRESHKIQFRDQTYM